MSVMLYVIYANYLAKAVKNLPDIDYIGIYADNIFAVVSGNPQRVSVNLNKFDYEINLWAKVIIITSQRNIKKMNIV